MNKYIVPFMIAIVLIFTGCEESIDIETIQKEARTEGYNSGYQDGYNNGYRDGINDAAQNKSQSKSQISTSSGYDYYILNKNTHKFHYPDCKSVSQMSEHNKEISYETRDQIINRGFKPCGNCNP